MKNKVRSPKTRKASSNRWLYRHINDPFVKKARQDNYRSRAAYKLREINEKFALIKKGSSVLELGSAPGGWSQVVAELVLDPDSVVAVDLIEMLPVKGVKFVQLDIELQKEEFLEYLGNRKFDVILSDIAPNTSGSSTADGVASVRLCNLVLEYAITHLKRGGSIALKLLRGSDDELEFVSLLKKKFCMVKYFKPQSSRKSSREIYLVGMKFAGSQ